MLSSDRTLLLFTKPARAGEVKTRLIGELSAGQTAELHAAFRDDLLERLAGGAFRIVIAWALRPDEPIPRTSLPGWRQAGQDLGERMYEAMTKAGEGELVAAVGSDHPLLTAEDVERAFAALEAGADMVFGPATDGGYYLVAGRRDSLLRAAFEDIEWSGPEVLESTLERCREHGVRIELLREAADVDTPEDLVELTNELAGAPEACPRTRKLLQEWGLLESRIEAAT